MGLESALEVMRQLHAAVHNCNHHAGAAAAGERPSLISLNGVGAVLEGHIAGSQVEVGVIGRAAGAGTECGGLRGRGGDGHGVAGAGEVQPVGAFAIQLTDAVHTPTVAKGVGVVARAADQRVVAGAAVQNIVARVAGEQVVAGVTRQRVVAGAADHILDAAHRAADISGAAGCQVHADGSAARAVVQRVRARAAV